MGSISKDEIGKAIALEELEDDLANLAAQANQINGAMQYVKQKIDGFKKPEEASEENNGVGK